MIVDAHHHLWNLEREPLPWMEGAPASISRTFEPSELEPLLRQSGVTATVLVQAANTDTDTDAMLEQAACHAWIGGVIGWIDLRSPARTAQRLGELQQRPDLRGVRHLIHDEQDPHWILRDEVLESLALVDAQGLLLELPCVYPCHLADVPALSAAFPHMTIVIDHLGKPPLGSASMAGWAAELRAAAASSNVHAKISGLSTILSTNDLQDDVLRPAVEVAVDAFGADRLVCGSDWPVSLQHGGYAEGWEQIVRVLEDVAPHDLDRLLSGTAARLYELELPGVGATT
jgi:L-fuconolactonase